MEEIVCRDVGLLPQLCEHRRGILLACDSCAPGELKYQLTKSLVNLLHNIVNTHSLPPEQSTKSTIEEYESVVWQLLNRRTALSKKQALLQNNPDLVLALAKACQGEP
jgi:hypothetical protein